MKFEIPKRKRRDPSEWHWRFAYLPVRVSATRVVWWEFYYCRLLSGWGANGLYCETRWQRLPSRREFWP